jgi:hypothetical protein
MSELSVARTSVIDALDAAGIRTATGGKLAAPCVLVEPGDPWTEPRRLPGRVSRWRLTIVAGTVDTTAAVDELADLVDRVDVALRTISGAQLPSWARPVEVELAGVRRGVTIGTIQLA